MVANSAEIWGFATSLKPHHSPPQFARIFLFFRDESSATPALRGDSACLYCARENEQGPAW
jgi:hypothetical protein